jgi:hypothetical protein
MVTALGQAAAGFVISALVLAGCADDAGNEAAPPASMATTVALAPEDVAREFLDAYGAFDADQAMTFLTDDALADGAGHAGSWGSEEDFRMEVAFDEASGNVQILRGCEPQGDSAEGTAVRCGFDVHAFHSEEIGLGPYTDNYWDLVVDDGKVTSAVATWAFLTNGFSAEVWSPFQAWVASTHPEDLPAMYLGNSAVITEESIRLWEQRTQEWAATVKAGAE